jgi:hypothetical protein
VNFAREHDLLASIKGGGHNVAGNAVNVVTFEVSADGTLTHIDTEVNVLAAAAGIPVR